VHSATSRDPPTPRSHRVTDDLDAEIARRFDPTIDDGDLPGTADDAAEFEIIPSWRKATAYGPLRNSAARDAYCRTHHG
jgi:hypothetical protein